MSVLRSLYYTYNRALEYNLVDRTDLLEQQTILLPVYHSSKKSMGTNDIIEVLLSEDGNFIKAEWIPKDQYIIFPITEDSIIRAGKVIAPHPLCDEFSYLSKELDEDKHKEYLNVLNDWLSFMRNGHFNLLLDSISNYLKQETILRDCINSLFKGRNYLIKDDYSVALDMGEKSEKTINFKKIFVTFKVETEKAMEENLSVTTDQTIHQNYIEYVRGVNRKKPQTKCDISNEETYCISRHRGLMGNAKLVSISNHDETYFGRFNNGEEIVHIGYEVSQKIHLMIKYLLENQDNRKQLGESCFLINWFSDDIGNTSGVDIINAISPSDDIEDDEYGLDSSPSNLGGGISSSINNYITGKKRDISSEGKFYLMILDKIAKGRISVKYFKELPQSDLFNRAEAWYHTTNWKFYNSKTKKITHQTPSLFNYADVIYGYENDNGFMECSNTKLRTKTVERLLPCIIDGKRIPKDIKNKMLENLCHRSSYDKTWNYVVNVGCSIFKKYRMDNFNRKEVKELLDTDKQDRSYLYGRMLSVYEKLEQDALRVRATENEIGQDDKEKSATNEKLITNAERLWTAYTKMPARTLLILENKIRPYKERLKKNNYPTALYYDMLTTDIMNRLSELDNFEQERNKPLTEEFIFGYYAQKQKLYQKNSKKQDEDNVNEEGGY